MIINITPIKPKTFYLHADQGLKASSNTSMTPIYQTTPFVFGNTERTINVFDLK